MNAPSIEYRRFHKAAVLFLAYTIFVILWGAFVRVSLSGDGCGENWPLCHGQVVPDFSETKTYIELAHRITSSLTGLFAIGLVVASRRIAPKGSLLRRTALASLLFIIFEGLVGAAQVKLGYVATNPSEARGYWAALHLTNTFFMILAISWMVRAAAGRAHPSRLFPRASFASWFGVFLLVIVSAVGAITALGDTIFPAETFAEGWRQKQAHDAHLFVRLRIVHPVLAIVTALYLLFLHIPRALDEGPLRTTSRAVLALLLVQMVVGFVNVLLAAPAALQIIHLFVADLLFIAVAFSLLDELIVVGQAEVEAAHPTARASLAPPG